MSDPTTPEPLTESPSPEFKAWMKQWHRAIGGVPADLLYSGDTVYAAWDHQQATIERLEGEKADIHQEGDRLRALLTVFVEREHGEPCRFDHHGYCQAHFLEEGVNCSVYQGRALLGLDTL